MYIYIQMCVCMYVCMYVYIYIYAYLYLCMSICICMVAAFEDLAPGALRTRVLHTPTHT